MMGPIDVAYRALGVLIGQALAAVGFLATAEGLQIDPADEVATEDFGELATAAALLQITTQPARTFLGRGAGRHIVERVCRVELAISSANRERLDDVLAQAVTALACIPLDNPTLSGAAERVALTGQDYDDLPSGARVSLDLTIRASAADPLGLVA